MNVRSFNWDKEQKEVFYKAAETVIAEARLSDKVFVDRAGFAICYEKQLAKVPLKGICKKGNRVLWKKVSKLPGFVDAIGRRRSAMHDESLNYNGYLAFELEKFGYIYQQ